MAGVKRTTVTKSQQRKEYEAYLEAQKKKQQQAK